MKLICNCFSTFSNNIIHGSPKGSRDTNVTEMLRTPIQQDSRPGIFMGEHLRLFS